ncbi:hypothetical protein SEA_BANTAM_57 [Gordonia phage Bantam]|uniref:Uncharacterized protein n=1 Tax=Gordonia phage Bantam TaxID=1887641 RepID=A0A1B3AYC4_9CAUD|nr:hypothetical protein BIZ77_gp121 [Gordonia phage Bantam]AOE43747.1 hypothetical protein SEA_BANTAM_57 [Gordonia phage Bantam]
MTGLWVVLLIAGAVVAFTIWWVIDRREQR